jgi:diacylglycerol kinase (ATP)
MADAPNRGLKRLVSATVYSWQGLVSTFRHEEAFRLELVLFVILAPLAYWLGDNGIERALLIGSLLLVLIVEVINSAIEATINRIGTERHVLSGQAKDMGSAAVFIALVNVAVIWLLVLV